MVPCSPHRNWKPLPRLGFKIDIIDIDTGPDDFSEVPSTSVLSEVLTEWNL